VHAKFLGYKTLKSSFLEILLVRIDEAKINSNPFMPLSTNSDAFQSPKKLVSKFDGFVCPQL